MYIAAEKSLARVKISIISPRLLGTLSILQSCSSILCIISADNTYDSLRDLLTMYLRKSVVCLLIFFVCIVSATELTFELEDNARQCFHEIVKKGTKTTLEYQVCSFLYASSS